ncbi:MAG: hypothetical protein P8J78_12550 [Maricaulis sp.]|nr:hypothetical protein [Maricaulis sp.]MDG2045432.1 hypothetical protein [Maricaulis sp.]
MAGGFQTPILALEFAKSPEDLAFLQGEGAAELRAALVRMQDLDRYFPIAYAGMAALLFLGLALRGEKLSCAIGERISLATGRSKLDLDEFRINLEVTRLIVIAPKISTLQLATWIKWGLIGLYAALMSVLVWQDKRRVLAIPGAFAAFAVAATWLSGSSGVVAELMGLALLPFMLSFPVAAAMYLFRPSQT